MFDAWCRSCCRRVLLSVRRIRRLHPEREAVAVEFECWCGQIGRESVPPTHPVVALANTA